jgi:hypothetical protein
MATDRELLERYCDGRGAEPGEVCRWACLSRVARTQYVALCTEYELVRSLHARSVNATYLTYAVPLFASRMRRLENLIGINYGGAE